MSKSRRSRHEPPPNESELLGDWQKAMVSWRTAVEAHTMAPPDDGFAARLAALSKSASEAARACRPLGAAGYLWPSARKTDSEPPYELRPGTGRRGPEQLWRRFDRAVTQLVAVAAGEDLLEVAGAYEELAQALHDLAEAVEQEDRSRATRRSRSERAA
jgi:hypothetical protein